MSTPLEEDVYHRLREMILSGELVSGKKLVQEDLSARLGVSRTPLRAAIAKLDSENFVRMSTRGEASVAEFGLRQIAEIFEMRAVLEGLICRLLAPKIERKHTIYLRSLMTSVADAVKTGDDAIYREADVEFHTYLTKLISGEISAGCWSRFIRSCVCHFRKGFRDHLWRHTRNTLQSLMHWKRAIPTGLSGQ